MHFQTHSGEKANKCNQCEYVFSQAGSLKAYLKIHRGEKSNQSPQDQRSPKGQGLSTKGRTHNIRYFVAKHSIVAILALFERLSPCPSSKLQTVGVIRGKSLTGEKFESSTQNKRFEANLTMHSREKSNKCNQCENTAFKADSVTEHLKTHSEAKSNKCSLCDFASSQANNMRRHLITHSGEKSNRCNKCDYDYSQAGNWREHLKIHSAHPQCKTMQPVSIYIYRSRHFKEKIENTQ